MALQILYDELAENLNSPDSNYIISENEINAEKKKEEPRDSEWRVTHQRR